MFLKHSFTDLFIHFSLHEKKHLGTFHQFHQVFHERGLYTISILAVIGDKSFTF